MDVPTDVPTHHPSDNEHVSCMVYYLCAIHTTNFDLASELSTLDLHMMTPSDVITDLTTTVPLQ